jgi:hypothetical protein
MSFDLTDDEYATMASLPIESLVDLAAELDLMPPASIDRRALLAQCAVALVGWGRREGLPFSKYDADDLSALPPQDVAALAALLGVQATPQAILKQGERVYRTFQARRSDHPIPLMLPMLLTAVARAARAG